MIRISLDLGKPRKERKVERIEAPGEDLSDLLDKMRDVNLNEKKDEIGSNNICCTNTSNIAGDATEPIKPVQDLLSTSVKPILPPEPVPLSTDSLLEIETGSLLNFSSDNEIFEVSNSDDAGFVNQTKTVEHANYPPLLTSPNGSAELFSETEQSPELLNSINTTIGTSYSCQDEVEDILNNVIVAPSPNHPAQLELPTSRESERTPGIGNLVDITIDQSFDGDALSLDDFLSSSFTARLKDLSGIDSFEVLSPGTVSSHVSRAHLPKLLNEHDGHDIAHILDSTDIENEVSTTKKEKDVTEQVSLTENGQKSFSCFPNNFESPVGLFCTPQEESSLASRLLKRFQNKNSGMANTLRSLSSADANIC